MKAKSIHGSEQEGMIDSVKGIGKVQLNHNATFFSLAACMNNFLD